MELRTLEQAVALLDDWIEAYRDLQRDFVRLHFRCSNAEWDRDSAEFLLKHLDPFLPFDMQNQKARLANPGLYAAIADLVEETRVPF